jgi:phospholipid/cholesterol/gamma-HCH transport system substrate-binding protein
MRPPAKTAGLLAILALAAGALLLWSRGPARYHVTAVFGDVRGLVKGADVRAGGLTVGRVDAIRLGRDGLPRVRLAVDRSYPLRQGARAVLRVASMSSEWGSYVSLTSGGGRVLADGAVLGRRSTSSPVQADQAIQALDPRTRSELHTVLARVDQGTAARGPDIARTLSHAGRALGQVGGLAGDVSADGAALRSLVADTGTLAGGLASKPDRLGASVDSTAALVHITAGRETELRDTLAALPAALAQAGGALSAGDRAIVPLRSLATAARPGLPQLASTANELRPLARAARPTFENAAALVRRAPTDLRALAPLLRDAQPVLAELTPTLRKAGPMLDQARVRLPDAFSFFSNWADFTSNYDANGHAARVGIVLPPASTRRLAPDSDGAGQLALPYLRTPGSLEGDPWCDYAKSFVDGGRAAADAEGCR